LPEAEEILAQLRNAVTKPHDNSMSVGMSFGLAFGGSLPLSMRDLRYEAERSAMSEKQVAKRASRHHVVRQVVERLRTFELVGEEHPDEQQLLAVTVGRALHLPEETLHKLSLLLQYHAIGKAVFDNALVYHAATQGEREEQQQHAAVGYRLALTLPDAAPVAELILKQHEYWDGSGCPFGLAGAEIPVECRVLAAVKEYQRLRRQWNRCLALPAEALGALHRMSGRS
jgi:HD-GYP domain-containing protein (c-di-GMP phosphodiesterase class II)